MTFWLFKTEERGIFQVISGRLEIILTILYRFGRSVPVEIDSKSLFKLIRKLKNYGVKNTDRMVTM